MLGGPPAFSAGPPAPVQFHHRVPSGRRTRSFPCPYTIIDGTLKWPFATVPYVIEDLSFPPLSVERAAIDAAVAAWNAGTAALKFAPRQAEDDYVQFTPDLATTASQVGRQGGRQTIQSAYFPAVPLTAPIAAIDQTGNQIDCLYFDAAGALRVNWVIDAGTWSGPVALTAPAQARPASPCARCARAKGRSTRSSSTATAWST